LIFVFFATPGVYTRAVSSSGRTERPALAKAGSRGDASRPLPASDGGSLSTEPFGALLLAAVENASAAQGLALAYAALERPQRERLIDAVLTDTHAAGMCPSGVLMPLLAVEEDLELARYIASAISASGGAGLRCDATCRAMLAGDSSEGAAVLVRPLHGQFVEVLALGWNRDAGVVHTVFEPLASANDVQRHARELGRARALEEIPVTFAVDVITSVLWHHRRLTGELPEVLTRFADLFEPWLWRGAEL
jgi:hypothetical protein